MRCLTPSKSQGLSFKHQPSHEQYESVHVMFSDELVFDEVGSKFLTGRQLSQTCFFDGVFSALNLVVDFSCADYLPVPFDTGCYFACCLV